MGIGPQGFSAYTAAGGRATFNFLGQEVAVYATEFDADTESSYTLDGKVASNRTSQGAGVGVLLFHSGVLSGTTHTLVIDVTQASDTSPFTLDWIEYNNTVRGVTPLVPNPSYAPSPSQSSPSPSLAKSSSTVSALASGNASKPSVSSAAVAGGVVGGLVGLTAILLAYLTLRSRRRWRMSRTTKYGYGEVAQRGTYTRVAVYICIPPSPINITGAAFASYIIDGTQAGASYVPFADLNLFVPRFAHFVSDMMIAIPRGTHNLTIEASGDPNHPYLLDYIVLYDQYLGPDHPYPGSPTYISSLSASPTSTTSTNTSESTTTQQFGPLNIPTTALSEVPTTSTALDTLPSASAQPSPSSPVASHIASTVLGSIAASAALLAMSYAMYMYRRHRKHGQTVTVPPRSAPGDPSSPDSRPLMAEADAPPVVAGPLGAAESHLYDVPTATAEGLYTTLVRHQTGKGKTKEIRLQPSQTSLDASYDSIAGKSAASSVLFGDPLPDNLPPYSRSPRQASHTCDRE
ncbi:hypothetical protein LXA43DRAFT_973561 [Ganoderma leucocontextum]|nr:hypothetical protein LXA43DRAFT_973561 [Ganoderma leucocontextum]